MKRRGVTFSASAIKSRRVQTVMILVMLSTEQYERERDGNTSNVEISSSERVALFPYKKCYNTLLQVRRLHHTLQSHFGSSHRYVYQNL